MRKIKKIIKDKNADVIYKDRGGIKQTKAWWENYVKVNGLVLEEDPKDKTKLLIRGKRFELLNKLTKQ